MLVCRILTNIHKSIYTFRHFSSTNVDYKIRDRISLDLVLPNDISQSLVLSNIKTLYPSQYVILKNFTKYPRSIFYNTSSTGKTTGYAISLLIQDLDKPVIVTTFNDIQAENLARFLIKISPSIKINLLHNNNYKLNSSNVIIGTIPNLIPYIKSIGQLSIIIYDDIHLEINKSIQDGVDNLSKLRRIVYERYIDKLPIEIGFTSLLDDNILIYLNEKLTGFYQYDLEKGTCQLISGNVNNDAIPLKAEFGYDFDIQTLFYKHIPKSIEHLVCKISSVGFGHKLHILYHLLKLFSTHNKCLVYVKNRHQAKIIGNKFTNACRFGRDLSKSMRGNMLDDFIKGNKNIFIATSTRNSKELSKVSSYIIAISPMSYNMYKTITCNFKSRCITLYDKTEYPLVVDLIRNVKRPFKVYVAPTNSEIEKASLENVIKDLISDIKTVDKNIFYTQVALKLVEKHGSKVLASLLNRLGNSL